MYFSMYVWMYHDQCLINTNVYSVITSEVEFSFYIQIQYVCTSVHVSSHNVSTWVVWYYFLLVSISWSVFDCWEYRLKVKFFRLTSRVWREREIIRVPRTLPVLSSVFSQCLSFSVSLRSPAKCVQSNDHRQSITLAHDDRCLLLQFCHQHHQQFDWMNEGEEETHIERERKRITKMNDRMRHKNATRVSLRSSK